MTDEPVIPKVKRISDIATERFANKPVATISKQPFASPSYAPSVLPDGAKLAMDDIGPNSGAMGWAQNLTHGMWQEGIGFESYPYYAALSQRSEFRQPCEIIAEEMTRRWINLRANGDEDKSDKINQLNDSMEHFGLREIFRRAIDLEGVMGLAFIYPQLMDATGNPVYLDTVEIQKKLLIDKSKIAKGSLKGFQVIDPTWCAPTNYNSNNPMDDHFFDPQEWFVMGRRVHASRLLKVISRPVPDILKPSYNFGGLSLVQMMKPYVDNWLRTRQSVSDLINSFTVWNLQTDMQGIMQDGGAWLERRLAIFADIKNNRGVMATDKEAEVLSNISAPLGSLDALQAQSQEQMSAPSRIPLLKALGYTPAGLNVTGDGEIRTFYDTIHAAQEKVMGHILKKALDIIQLHLFGEIDPDISFEFMPLYQLNEAGLAAVQKILADVDAVYIQSAVIAPEEARDRIRNDPASPYDGLKGPAPEPTDLMGEPNTKDDSDKIGGQAANQATSGANSGF